MSGFEELYREGFAPFNSPLPLTCNEWANKHFYLSKGSSSIEGRWESLAFQVGILNWLGSDDIRIIDIKKAARLGCTKMMCAAVGYFAEHKQRNQVFYQPTDGDAASFVSKEIDPMLTDIEALRKICKSNPEKRSSNSTTTTKNFFGSNLDILGGKSPRNYRRLTKDVVYYDELSGFDLDIAGEGSPTKLGDKRIETSSFPKSIRGSTPKIKNECLISASIERADAIFYRFLLCPYCGGSFRLKWKTGDLYHFDNETSRYICEFCGAEIDYSQYPEMDKAGEWATDDGSIIYDEKEDIFRDSDGEIISAPRHIGVVIWSAYSYFVTWSEIIKEWNDANKLLKDTGDFTELKSFVNIVLGEEWEEKGERVDPIAFDGSRLDAMTTDRLSNDILFLTMGVDVQGGKTSRVEYEILGHGIGEESWSVEYAAIKGDLQSVHTQDNLDAVRAKVFYREDGAPLNISCCLVDSGYDLDAVYNYTTPRQRQRVYATKGFSVAGKPIESGYTMQGALKKTRLYMVGADTAKSVFFYRLNKILEPGPGYCHFPDHYSDEYFQMLTAEEKRKVKNKKTGKTTTAWVKIRDRNEALDCRILNMVALKILNPNFAALKRRLLKLAARIAAKAGADPAVDKEKTETPARTTARRPNKRPKKKEGFAGGFTK